MDIAAMKSGLPFQFGLGRMLLLFTGASAMLTGMRKVSEDWTVAIVTATMVAVLIAIILAVYGAEERRPARCGFALFAGLYFLASFCFSTRSVMVNLATTKSVEFLLDYIHPTGPLGSELVSAGFEPSPRNIVLPPDVLAQITGTACYFPLPRWVDGKMVPGYSIERYFRQIGHASWCILLGGFGAFMAQGFRRINGRRKDRLLDAMPNQLDPAKV